MREVDARGLSCPEPLMLTAEAIKSDSSPVKVLVTEPHQKTNVEKSIPRQPAYSPMKPGACWQNP